jgi:hypothetical protein
VTPLFRFVFVRRPLLPSHFRLNRRGMAPRLFCRLSRSKGSNVIGRIRDTGLRIGRGLRHNRAPPGETGKRRSTIETIQDARLKQFCASKPHGLSKPVNPREAKTSRWSLTTPAALFSASRGTQDAHACLAVAEAPGEGCVSGAPLRDVGRRHWLCRASRDGSDTSNASVVKPGKPVTVTAG